MQRKRLGGAMALRRGANQDEKPHGNGARVGSLNPIPQTQTPNPLTLNP
jgi:hypothetical protein